MTTGGQAERQVGAADLAHPRVMVLWCPDWPVVAAAGHHDLSLRAPVAVVEKGEVFACSSAARAEGVARGMRRRDAASRCPELAVLERAPEVEVRAFEAVLSGVEEVATGVSPLRPGLCAMGVPSRFYGGEREAAAVVAEQLVGVGVWDTRTGVADGIFAAEHAARRAPAQDCWVVEPGGSASFLGDLPVSVLDDHALVVLLRRLGIRSLGDFASLSPRDVLTRFGHHGAMLHRLARGQDGRVASSRQPPVEVQQHVSFDPPLETIEPIVFSTRQTADRCVAELARHGLVATEVRIEVHGDGGWLGSRVWSHSRWFASSDLVDRIYWQLQADPSPEPVTEVRLCPERVESLGDHGEGLWGSSVDEHVERGIARLQGMLGPDEVRSAAVQGGRSPRARQQTSPWGERGTPPRRVSLPWPGSIPPPAPARVFAEPLPSLVLGVDGRPVQITERGLVSAPPASFRAGRGAALVQVHAWTGPWPIDELWWDLEQARQVARFQIVGVDGSAWLLVVEDGQWWTEARYD